MNSLNIFVEEISNYTNQIRSTQNQVDSLLQQPQPLSNGDQTLLQSLQAQLSLLHSNRSSASAALSAMKAATDPDVPTNKTFERRYDRALNKFEKFPRESVVDEDLASYWSYAMKEASKAQLNEDNSIKLLYAGLIHLDKYSTYFDSMVIGKSISLVDLKEQLFTYFLGENWNIDLHCKLLDCKSKLDQELA